MYNYIIIKEKPNIIKSKLEIIGFYSQYKKVGKKIFYAKDGVIKMYYVKEEEQDYFIICRKLYIKQNERIIKSFIKETLGLKVYYLFFSLTSEDNLFKKYSKSTE